MKIITKCYTTIFGRYTHPKWVLPIQNGLKFKLDGNLTNKAIQPEWSIQMNRNLIATLKSHWGGNLIPVSLTRINWVDKTTGEDKHAFAYSSNPRVTVTGVGPANISCSITVQGQDSNGQNNITLWCNEMDEEMFNLYQDEGFGDATYNLDSQSIEYPSEVESSATEEEQIARSMNADEVISIA